MHSRDYTQIRLNIFCSAKNFAFGGFTYEIRVLHPWAARSTNTKRRQCNKCCLSHGHTLGEFDETVRRLYRQLLHRHRRLRQENPQRHPPRRRSSNPDAAVGVCGCYAQSAPDEVRALGVDVMVGTADREAFVLQMEQAAQDKKNHAHWEKVAPSNLPPRLRAAARRRSCRAHPCAFKNRRRLQQLLHLLHHPLCQRARPLHAVGGCRGRNEKACPRGLPRNRRQRHRNLLLGLGMEKWQPPVGASACHLSGCTRGPHPPRLFRAAHHRRRLLQNPFRL